MKIPAYIQKTPEMMGLLVGADHVDVKTVESEVPMRQFIVNMLEYQPAWITFLYGVRFFFVRLLGMKQTGIPRPLRKKPEELPMQMGKKASFFTVEAAKEDGFWVAGISEAHLTARLGVVVETLKGDLKRYYVVTIVHYNRWTGPLYFNVIRPFHHLVVRSMMRAGVGLKTSAS